MFGGIFHGYLIFDRFFGKQTVETLIRHHLLQSVSDLGFDCLSWSHRKDARLIWVNMKNRGSPKISNIEMRIWKWYFDIQNCTFNVTF